MSTEAPRSAEPVASDLTDLARQCGGYPLDSVPEWTVMTPQDLLQFRAALASSHPTPAEPAPSEGDIGTFLMRCIDAYAFDYAKDGKLAGSRIEVEGRLRNALATPQRAEPTTEQAALDPAYRGSMSDVDMQRFAAPHRPAAPRLSDVTETVLRDVCEMEPANPNLNDTICIDISDLKVIVDRAIAAILDAPESAPGGQS